ncbi:MAG: hypothetical protein ACO21T_13800 [Alphaproteobacteria bacterium]
MTAEEIGEAKQLKTNLGFILKVFGTAIFVVYSGAMIYARLNTLEMDILRLHHEVKMNSEFRIKWPRGELGSLPDDAEQNMRLKYLEGVVEKMETQVDKLRFHNRIE